MAIKAFELFGEISLKGDKATLSGLKNISVQVNTTEKDLKKFRDEVDRASKSQSNFSQGFLSSFGIQRGQGIGALLGNATGNLVQSGVRALTGHITDAMQQGMEFADQIQKWKFAFTSMAGDETKGLTHLMELMKYGKDSAFETTDVINFAQQLEAVKVKGQEVIPMLEGIGGALAKSGRFSHEALEGSVLAITQILSKGQVSAEEMQRQLSQYIPNPYGYAARGFNRLGYRDDKGGEFTDATVRQYAEEKRFNPDAFVRILTDQLREESKGLLDKFVSGSISGTQAQLDDTKLFLFAQSMLGGGDMLGEPGGAYAQRLANLKKQIDIYGGPEAKKIGSGLGAGAQLYYSAMGFGEEHMFDANLLSPGLMLAQQIMPFDKFKQLGATIGPYLPEGIRDGLIAGSQGLQDVAKKVMGEDLYNALASYWQTNSPSKKTIQMGEWLREGLEIGLNKQQAGNYANLKKLSEQSPDFIRKLSETAARLGTNPDYLLNVFARESSLNPNAYNPSGGTGLFQLMPMHAQKLGLPGGPQNKDAFRRAVQSLGAEGQLDLFYRYITEIVGVQNFKDQASAYASVFMPKYTNASPDAVVAQRGTKNYSQNTGLDRNRDGLITKRELGLEAEGALGAGKFFSVNGAPVAKTNPMPVEIVDYGNGVDFRSGPSSYANPSYNDPGLSTQISAARNAYASRRSFRAGAGIGTINDPVPVDGGTVYDAQPQLTTSMIMLTESALNLKKPLDLLTDSATAAATGLTKASLEGEHGPAIIAAKQTRKKRDRLFEKALTWEGAAGDFQGGLQGALMNPFKKDSWGNFGRGLLQDIQGRAAHDLSSSITQMLFGGRKDPSDPQSGLTGGLLSSLFGGFLGGGKKGGGWGDFKVGFPGQAGGGGGIGGIFSKIFGSIFGGFRASGGGMSPGRFYIAGENGPEAIWSGAGGHVYNNSQTRQMMQGGSSREQRFIFVDSERAADRHRSARADNFIMEFRRNRHIISKFR